MNFLLCSLSIYSVSIRETSAQSRSCSIRLCIRQPELLVVVASAELIFISQQHVLISPSPSCLACFYCYYSWRKMNVFFTGCVFYLLSERPEEICNLPATRGHCRAMMTRYRYDPKVKDCVQFHFGGCEGNANNFVTKEKCMVFCEGQQTYSSSARL